MFLLYVCIKNGFRERLVIAHERRWMMVGGFHLQAGHWMTVVRNDSERGWAVAGVGGYGVVVGFLLCVADWLTVVGSLMGV